MNPIAVQKRYRKRAGRVMFPTTHDLVPDPELLEPCLTVLQKLLASGNEVLVTTKPSLAVVKEICQRFERFQEQVQFRFTVGSLDGDMLAFWESGRPSFAERQDSVKWAYNQGFKTSVSMNIPRVD